MQTEERIGQLPAASPLDLKTLRAEAVDTHKAGKLETAISLYRQFLSLVPTDASIWSNLGVAHRILHEYDAAVGCYQRALELKPDDAGFLSNLGNALKDLDRMEDSIAAHARAAAIAPEDFNTRHNFGIALRDAGHFDDALREFAAAMKIRPENANPRWDSAVCHLYKGDYVKGWAEYESRWQIGEIQKRQGHLPEWRGEDCTGKAICFYPEQGFGDTLLAVRFLPWVKARGAKVYLECKPPLRRLFAALEGVDALLDPDAGPPPDTDLVAPLMALPGLYGANLENLPAVPRLHVPQEARARALHLMGPHNGRFRIGVVWSGSVTFKRNQKRSVGVERFLPLSHVPGIQLYSLQKGPREGDIHAHGASSLMIDIGSKVQDFAETAACIEALDLVIMTDSSVAHLCGCLGKPVWNLLNHSAYWLYLTGRDDTPWYPSMRFYRQPVAGNWDDVFSRVQADLRGLVTETRQGVRSMVH